MRGEMRGRMREGWIVVFEKIWGIGDLHKINGRGLESGFK